MSDNSPTEGHEEYVRAMCPLVAGDLLFNELCETQPPAPVSTTTVGPGVAMVGPTETTVRERVVTKKRNSRKTSADKPKKPSVPDATFKAPSRPKRRAKNSAIDKASLYRDFLDAVKYHLAPEVANSLSIAISSTSLTKSGTDLKKRHRGKNGAFYMPKMFGTSDLIVTANVPYEVTAARVKCFPTGRPRLVTGNVCAKFQLVAGHQELKKSKRNQVGGQFKLKFKSTGSGLRLHGCKCFAPTIRILRRCKRQLTSDVKTGIIETVRPVATHLPQPLVFRFLDAFVFLVKTYSKANIYVFRSVSRMHPERQLVRVTRAVAGGLLKYGQSQAHRLARPEKMFSTPKSQIESDASRHPTDEDQTIHQLFRHLVTTLLHNSCLQDALFYAEGWTAWFPGDDEARVSWAKTLALTGQHRACLDVLTSKIGIRAPWDRTSLYLQAQACLALGMETRGQIVMDKLLRELDDGMDSLQMSEVAASVDIVSLRLLRAKFLQSDQDKDRRVDDLKVALENNPFCWDAFTQLCNLGDDVDVDQLFPMTRCLQLVESTGFLDKMTTSSSENRATRVALSPKNKLASVNTIFFYGVRTSPAQEAPAAPKPTKTVKPKIKSLSQPSQSIQPLKKTFKPTKPLIVDKKRDRGGNPIRTDELDKVDKLEKKKLLETALQTLLSMLRRMAKGYYHLSRFRCKEAIAELSSLPSAQLNSGLVSEWIARAHFERADYHRAHEVFESVRRREPWRVSGTDIHSITLWHMRRPMELSHLAQHLIDIAPNSSQRWIVAGNCFSLRQEHENAIGCFEKAVLADPHCAYAHTLIGHEHVLNEDLDRALKSFQTAMTLDSCHYNAWYGMGSIFYRQGKYELALAHFNEALQINQSNPILICYQGMVLQKKNMLREALECFKCAEKLAPENPLVVFRQAHVLAVMERYTEALGLLERLKDKTQECNVYFLLGLVHKKLGDHRQALVAFTLAQDARNKDAAMLKDSIDNVRREDADSGFEVVVD